MSHPRLRVKWLMPLVGALAATTIMAPAAEAKLSLLNVLNPCDGKTAQVFRPWGDWREYSLAAGGDFEGDLSSWTLTGGATRTPGSEPFGVTGTVGKSSLLIPPGASATSEDTCIDLTRGTFRFFARSDAPTARLNVDVLYVDLLTRKLRTVSLGTLSAPQRSWTPTAVLSNPLLKLILSAIEASPTVVYRFTAVSGAVQIDDLHIDPRMNR